MTTLAEPAYKIVKDNYGAEYPNIDLPSDIYRELTIDDIAEIWTETPADATLRKWEDDKAFTSMLTDDNSMTLYTYKKEADFVKRVNERIAEWREDEHPEWWSITEIISDCADTYRSLGGWG